MLLVVLININLPIFIRHMNIRQYYPLYLLSIELTIPPVIF